MTSITIMNILLFLMPYLLGTIIGYNAGKRKYVQLYYNWKRKKAWMKIKSNRQLIYKLHDAPYGRCDQNCELCRAKCEIYTLLELKRKEIENEY